MRTPQQMANVTAQSTDPNDDREEGEPRTTEGSDDEPETDPDDTLDDDEDDGSDDEPDREMEERMEADRKKLAEHAADAD